MDNSISFSLHELEVLQRAYNTFGTWSQLDMCTEECAELIAAINHFKRCRPSSGADLEEEIADVIIMVTQIIMGLNISSDVKCMISKKIKRLEGRLNG